MNMTGMARWVEPNNENGRSPWQGLPLYHKANLWWCPNELFAGNHRNVGHNTNVIWWCKERQTGIGTHLRAVKIKEDGFTLQG